MELGIKSKKAVILGGTRGIGLAIAETLAAEGADVAICARNADQVAEKVSALEAKGVRATGAAVDVSDLDALKGWIRSVGETLGGIDMLFSSAGAMAQGNDPASWEQNLKLDVLGAVSAFDAAEPFLGKAADTHGDAAFIMISSVSALVSDNPGAYGPMKAALIHHAKGLARQHAGRGIRANVVSPGMVYFEGGIWHQVEQGMPDFYKKALSRNPMGRMASPQDVASAAVFLASPVSAFTTGANLVVDGAISNRVDF